MADKFRMIRLGMPPELAQEVSEQIDAGGGGDGQALTVAERAEGKADEAIFAAGEAQVDADAAFVAASTAQGTATAAQTTANAANGLATSARAATGPTIADLGAVGDGTTNDRAAFVAANATGSIFTIAPPSVRYELTTPYTMTGAMPHLDESATWGNLTDGGQFSWGYGSGFRDEAYTPVHRLPGRALFGAESNHSANRFGTNGYGNSPIAQQIASYIIKNAQAGSTHYSPNGRIGFAGGCWIQPGAAGNSAIAVAGIARHDGISGAARGGYFEAVMASTVAGLASTAGEFQVGNHTPFEPVVSAYSMAGSVVNGIQIAPESQHLYTTGDADTLYPDAPQPAGAAVDISGGSLDVAYMKFTAGIVFRNGALKRDGSLNADAMLLAQRHRIRWEAASGTPGAQITSTVAPGAGADQRLVFVNGGIDHRNSSGGAIHTLSATDGVVNGFRFEANVATSPVFIRSQGADANIDIRLIPKGTGTIGFGTFTTSADVPVTGYITIKDALGSVRKLAVIA